MVRNTGKGSFILLIEVFMRESSLKTKFLVMVFILGMMGRNIRAIGNRTKWMEKEYLNGLMARNMREISRMINVMGLENFDGKMEKYIKGLGLRGNSTVLVLLCNLMVLNERANGRTVNDLNGSIN